METKQESEALTLTLKGVNLKGDLVVPEEARGLVLFSHGSGSSRLSPRNRYVAEVLQQEHVATLLFDLLTEAEDRVYATRFDIDLLTRRLIEATLWIRDYTATAHLPLGYFGASTGAASALRAAAHFGREIGAVVSRGGRPDLAGEALPGVQAPTLLLVGGWDHLVLDLNREAYQKMKCTKDLKVIPEASHLFQEPGKLEHVAELSAAWFTRWLPKTDNHV